MADNYDMNDDITKDISQDATIDENQKGNLGGEDSDIFDDSSEDTGRLGGGSGKMNENNRMTE